METFKINIHITILKSKFKSNFNSSDVRIMNHTSTWLLFRTKPFDEDLKLETGFDRSSVYGVG